jgi:ubiquinone/menaquinone biosynthesis C-methylase UbiE
MDPDLRAIADSFDQRAPTYARSEWHRHSAERIVVLCDIQPGSLVLVACTGTAFAAVAAARAVGPEGRVVGVDISPGMLREAAAAVAASGHANVELMQADVGRPAK